MPQDKRSKPKFVIVLQKAIRLAKHYSRTILNLIKSSCKMSCTCWFSICQLSLSSRRGLFRSPSDPSARLLAHRSHSFDVRPHPVTLKRQDRHDDDDDTTPQLMKRHRGILLSDSAVPSPRKVSGAATPKSNVFIHTYISQTDSDVYNKNY